MNNKIPSPARITTIGTTPAGTIVLRFEDPLLLPGVEFVGEAAWLEVVV
jgi:hypothetical protein